MLANADLDMDESEQQFYQPITGGLNTMQKSQASDMVALGGTQTSYKMPAQPKKKQAPAIDDEDRYLDEILNRNYTGARAPPAIN